MARANFQATSHLALLGDKMQSYQSGSSRASVWMVGQPALRGVGAPPGYWSHTHVCVRERERGGERERGRGQGGSFATCLWCTLYLREAIWGAHIAVYGPRLTVQPVKSACQPEDSLADQLPRVGQSCIPDTLDTNTNQRGRAMTPAPPSTPTSEGCILNPEP